ncbi:restriction endonuclease subunit S [Bacillus cereus]|nr:restriction endonuclease subunit S [Bacillus cereus]PFQ37936.1 restriction endonuclease subunit S [Bacillus cereus]PGT09810.1 restriction endonuclease subunit S [Bacillus cereus]PGX11209.1 restriction endonuclease subunit S [Bacillus cereus]
MVTNWRKVQLDRILKESRELAKEQKTDKRLTVKLHLQGVQKREERATDKIGSTVYFKRKAGQFIYGKQNLHNGAIGIIPNELNGYQSTQDVPAFDVSEEVDVNWLYYYFARPSFYKNLESLATGTGSKRIQPKELLKLDILVPPLVVQKKITEILSSVDKAIEKTEGIIEQKEKIKKGLVQQLLAKGIGHTKFKKTEIGDIPKDWEVVTIDECCEILDNRRVPLSKEVRETMQGEIPYYGATGVVDYINDYLFDEEIVLIGEDGDHFKKFRDWSMTNLVRGKSWVNNHAHIIRAKTSVTNEWIYRFLEHRDITPYLSIQGATRLKLTQQNLRQIKVAIPSKEEQKQVTTIIESVDKKKEIELKRLMQLRDIKKGLMQSLLTERVRVKVDEDEVTQV